MSEPLEDRMKAFEAKYKHDEEFKFRVRARTAKLFGFWVAEQLGLEGADAEAYAKQVVEADFEEPSFDDVYRKVNKDLGDKGIEISQHHLEVEMDRCMTDAQSQLSQD